VAGSCEHGDEPLGSIKYSSCWTVRLSRRNWLELVVIFIILVYKNTLLET
jgi:hypothetical protein